MPIPRRSISAELRPGCVLPFVVLAAGFVEVVDDFVDAAACEDADAEVFLAASAAILASSARFFSSSAF